MIRRLFGHSLGAGLTLVELIAVVLIIAILAAIVAPALIPKNTLERHARVVLKLLWQAEKDYFAYRNRYTAKWEDLNLGDPNLSDPYYTYEFEDAESNLRIKATRKGRRSGLRIDKNGRITAF